MEKYNHLLLNIAQQYAITKGEHEPEKDWKIRIVYSICGMMAYTSLWDYADEEEISIVHLKRRVRRILSSYCEMYPEIASQMVLNTEAIENEVYDILLRAGVLYHSPNRITPSIYCSASFQGISFVRGITPDDIKCVSGLGFYEPNSSSNSIASVKQMFGIEKYTLKKLWETTAQNADWYPAKNIQAEKEYLRLTPPFSRGYWVSKPDDSGIVSLMRTGFKGQRLYYLYKFVDNNCFLSSLPQWQVEEYNYRYLACACLTVNGMLPPIKYHVDGELIHIKLTYLLPPRELNFLKLYSWPETTLSMPCDFYRKCAANVFAAIKELLSEKGFTFEEE